MRKLTMANGKTVDVESCGQTGNKLIIALHGVSNVLEAYNMFGHAEDTIRMTCDYGGGLVRAYDGYTNLFYVVCDTDGLTNIGLMKETV